MVEASNYVPSLQCSVDCEPCTSGLSWSSQHPTSSPSLLLLRKTCVKASEKIKTLLMLLKILVLIVILSIYDLYFIVLFHSFDFVVFVNSLLISRNILRHKMVQCVCWCAAHSSHLPVLNMRTKSSRKPKIQRIVFLVMCNLWISFEVKGHKAV